jgi:hypothetical protein
MECNETGWSSGDELPLSSFPAGEEACVVNDAVFQGMWVTAWVLGLLLLVHAATKFPQDDKMKYAIQSAKDLKGALPLWYEPNPNSKFHV